MLLCDAKYTSRECEATGLYLSDGSLDCNMHGLYIYQFSHAVIQPLLKKWWPENSKVQQVDDVPNCTAKRLIVNQR
jgi:hypothetical protein